MAEELAGKVAVVTGAASGIGRGVAERFLAEGARVVLADVNAEQCEAMAAESGADARFKQTDVSDQDQVRDLVSFAVETFGGLHVMFNNAGISGARHPRLLDDDLADFDKVTSVNLLGVMAGTREAARHMSTNGGGSIINISSIGGIQAAPGMWSYHTSKVGVIFFTKCAAVDVGEYGIRVNCIAPGNIETPILSSVMAADMPEDEKAELMKRVREFIISRQAIKRQGTTSDIAEAALYLASDRSSYITGTLLPVDGGMTAGAPPETAKSFEAIKQGSAKP
jgi:NAD(P)-dependent dehydrogenase (short-subunit alcohol dehydrogenase family)